MRNSKRPSKTNLLNQIREPEFRRKFIEHAWAILIILTLVTMISYSIYVQFAHHIFRSRVPKIGICSE